MLRADLAVVYDAFETPRQLRTAVKSLPYGEALAYMEAVRERMLDVVRERGADPASSSTLTPSIRRCSSNVGTGCYRGVRHHPLRVVAATFRNWDLPCRPRLFAGLRVAADAAKPVTSERADGPMAGGTGISKGMAYRYEHFERKLLAADMKFLDGPEPGQPMPDFELPTTEGETIRRSDFVGSRPLLLTFASFT